MGGQILELESERLIRVGNEEGLAEGLEKGIKKGLTKGELIAYFKLVQDKTLTLSIAAQKANISEDEFVDAMKKAGY